MDNSSHIIKDWAIVTVPRVGSHYLQERIFVHTGLKIIKYHQPTKKHILLDDVKIITIVRDPRDLLISDITMSINQKHSDSLFTGKGSLEQEKIKSRADKYCDDYIKLETLSSIVIDYNDLISLPLEVTYFIANRLGLKIITNKYITNIKDNIETKYLVSSKKVEEYEVVSKAVDQINLSEFYEAYDKIKSKCISL